jgi:hypothetical protein
VTDEPFSLNSSFCQKVQEGIHWTVSDRAAPADAKNQRPFHWIRVATADPGVSDERQGIADASRATSRGELVAMYAAQSTEPTVERPLPDEAEVSQRLPYGLLSFTINQILTRATTPLTYRELTLRVQQQYTAWGRVFPTPLIEGDGADREVLGTRQWPGRSRITLTVEAGGVLRLNGGSLAGLTPGSILAIYPPAGEQPGDNPAGHVKVTRCAALDSDGVPCEYNGQPAVTKLPAGGRAEVVHIDSGLRPLRIAIDLQADAARPDFAAAIQAKLEVPAQVIQFVANPQQADWAIQQSDKGLLLVPATGSAQREAAAAASDPPSGTFGPYPQDDRLPAVLAENLGKIARVQHLLSLSEPVDGGRIASGAVNVQLELLLHKGEMDRIGTPIDLTQGAVKLGPGELLGFKIHNNGRTAADATLLYIDEQYGISSWFPKTGTITDNRLQPGASIGPPDIRRAELEPGTIGMQHMVLVATVGEGFPQSFTWLEQPSIQKVRDVPKGERGGLESDLEKLFAHALYGEGNTRAIKEERAANYAIRTISWQFK